MEAVLRKARFWERLADAPLHPRQRAMLERLLEGFVGKLTTSKWAALTKCSQDTALRDVEALVARGILVRDKAGRAEYELFAGGAGGGWGGGRLSEALGMRVGLGHRASTAVILIFRSQISEKTGGGALDANRDIALRAGCFAARGCRAPFKRRNDREQQAGNR